MKYYSETLKKVFDTPEDLQKAEAAHDKARAAEVAKQKERKARADEVSNARKAVVEAQKKYDDLLNKFVKDYGSYHATYTDSDMSDSVSSILKILGLL